MRLGKDKQATLLAVFLLFSASAFGQAGKSYKYRFDGNLQKSDVIKGDQSIIINYSISELNFESVINADGSFYHISIPGHIHSVDPGKPELPVYSQLISIPDGSEYKIRISEVISSVIKPSGKNIEGILFPAQEGETKEVQAGGHDFKIDKTVYAKKGIITADTVKIESLGTSRNTRLANLYISPVFYDPQSNRVEVISSMKIEISFTFPGNIKSKSLLAGSTLFNETTDKAILSYNQEDIIPGFSEQPVTMVIITDSAFRKQLEPFLKWKTQKGFRLKVLYKGTEFAGNTFTQIKDTLTRIYNASSVADPPPEYLLIIGDTKIIPYYGTGNVTDMYYGEFDGNGDYIPEMFVGRLPVADTAELRAVLSKIIQYEKFEFADSNKFYTRALVTGGNDAGYSNYMNGQIKYATSYYLNSANGITESHFYYPQSITASSMDSIKKLINNGASFINYTGHGSADGWLFTSNGSTYYLNSTEVAGLTNKNMYSFVISNACRTSTFNLATSFGNRMVLTDEKGSVGFIGCSNDSYWDEDFYWSVGACTPSNDPTYQGTGLGAYDRLFHTHGETASNWYFTMGQINYAGNMAVSASNSAKKKYYWETYNLVGDPSVIPILGRPDSFKISLPDTLPNGIKSLSLITDPFAYVAVSHFDTLWDASYSSFSGSVVLDMPGLSDDSCLVVITGQNKVPVMKTILFSDINKEFINLSSNSINDSQGNNNGEADFGEDLYLNLKVSNMGLTDANSLYAKITSSSDWITINTDSVFIGTLNARSDITLSDKLGISILENVPDKGVATINLTLKDQKSEKHYVIDMLIHAPELQIISCNIDDSSVGNNDHIADPGETFSLIFKIRNQGSSSISGQFRVSSPDPDMSVLEPDKKSGLLKFGEITDIPITVKLSGSAFTGSYFSVSSILDCDPFLALKDFTFRVGRIRESFEAASFSVFPWINLSNVPWTISASNYYDGSVSARSGAISHNASSSLIIRTVYSAADSVKFYYKVSSEPSYDNLSFSLNDKEIFKKSGETSWTKKAIAVPAGLNKLEWIYRKDNSVSAGSDCAWIDMIDFAGSVPVSYIQKDLQIVRILTPAQKDKYGKETVSVLVRNLGRDPVTGFYLAYKVNNDLPQVKQYFENNIPFNDSVSVSFNVLSDLTKYGIYKIAAYGVDNNDDYLLNDTLRITLENVNLDETISVYPNPFGDKFTIFINSRASETLQISITNIEGIKLYNFEKSVISGKNEIIISDIKLSPAIYYLNMRGNVFNKTISVLKIIK
jgi:hypothetical protein